jgi:RNA polymerase sigma-70 factor (ECF subfamily)
VDSKVGLKLVVPPSGVEEGMLDLDQAFRRFAPLVASVALRITGRPHEVDDLVQDIFLDARRSVERIRRPAAIRAWLMTATVRLARRRLRRRRLWVFLGIDELPAYEALADRAASPFHRAFLAEVYRILDCLPVDDRVAWILRHVQGEELEQVARLCGCSLATSKRRIVRAQQRIDEAFCA